MDNHNIYLVTSKKKTGSQKHILLGSYDQNRMIFLCDVLEG